MEAAHMTYKEEVSRLRAANRRLSQDNALFKHAHEQSKQKAIRLEQENKTLRREVKRLRDENRQLHSRQKQLEKQVESCLLLIEELRGMVFGKKRSKDK